MNQIDMGSRLNVHRLRWPKRACWETEKRLVCRLWKRCIERCVEQRATADRMSNQQHLPAFPAEGQGWPGRRMCWTVLVPGRIAPAPSAEREKKNSCCGGKPARCGVCIYARVGPEGKLERKDRALCSLRTSASGMPACTNSSPATNTSTSDRLPELQGQADRRRGQ